MNIKKLYELKRDLVRAHRARMNVNEEKLEHDIRTILEAIMDLEDAPATEPLSFDALHVADKIKAPFVLKKTVTDYAVNYYNYIEYVFSNSDVDFDLIASQIKTSSMMLENSGLSQREVVKELSDWIREKAGLGSDSALASEVVVSFFVQNCEVFHP
jgi:Zn-ribbon containing protein